MTRLSFLAIFFFCSCSNESTDKTVSGTNEKWELIPFIKADSANPILVPDTAQVFMCPVLKKQVKWEEKDVFNPACVVRNDTVFLLYRAEDRIGKYAGTSRIGVAWSVD